MSIRILGISGSTRTASLNRKVLEVVLEEVRSLGAEAHTMDLRTMDLPLYDGDLEAEHGSPEMARHLADRIREADAVVIASPEYNGGYSAVLKNAIDWTSRPDTRDDGTRTTSPWSGKVTGLLSASPGSIGGLRGLILLRTTLAHMGSHVIPEQLGVPEAHAAIGEDGRFVESGLQERALGVARALVHAAERLG